MKYCISGSHGFIGSHLTRMLKGQEVIGISQKLLYAPNDLKEFFEKEKPDYIIHLAAFGNMANQQDVAMIVFSNLIGTYNMLSASKDIPYKKFIQVGSSSEYGRKDYPMSESDLPETDTFYGASKVGATYLARAFAVQKPVVIVRPFSIYGEDEADFRFIPTIIKSMETNKEMLLDPAPAHDWIYIEDFISGMLTAAEYAKPGEIVNIGTGKEHTNLQIVETLQRIAGKQVKYKASKIRDYDNTSWCADIKKLLSYGWKQKYPLGLGLAKTYEFYKARYVQ
jgi:nucleoside-diphosphate-sugar epimerase